MTDASAAHDRRWFALAVVCAAQFMVVLDASIVNVALPSMKDALGFSNESLQWVVNAYVLIFGGFLLLGGRLADLLGRRRVFLVGLAVFTLASLVGGLAQSSGMLVAARTVQGLGAALVSPAALSIVTTMFAEGPDRNKAMGIWGAAAGSGGAVGALLGGVLTEYLSWEWVLFVNVPVGILLGLLTPSLLSESRREGAERHFDLPGALTVTGGLVALVFGMVKANDWGWGSGRTLGMLALAVVLIAAFAVIEQRGREPLVPFRIFRHRTRTGANLTMLIVGGGLFSMFFFATLYMQQVLGYSPVESGLAWLPLSVGIIASAGAASQLVGRFGARPVMVAGLVLMAAGLLGFSQISVDGSYLADVFVPSMLAAVGLGLTFVPLTLSAVTEVAPADAGLASGLLNTAQQIGGALGLAILTTVSTSRFDGAMTDAHGAPSALPQALTEGFQSAFVVGTAFAVVGAILALVLVRNVRVPDDEDAAPVPVAG